MIFLKKRKPLLGIIAILCILFLLPLFFLQRTEASLNSNFNESLNTCQPIIVQGPLAITRVEAPNTPSMNFEKEYRRNVTQDIDFDFKNSILRLNGMGFKNPSLNFDHVKEKCSILVTINNETNDSLTTLYAYPYENNRTTLQKLLKNSLKKGTRITLVASSINQEKVLAKLDNGVMIELTPHHLLPKKRFWERSPD